MSTERNLPIWSVPLSLKSVPVGSVPAGYRYACNLTDPGFGFWLRCGVSKWLGGGRGFRSAHLQLFEHNCEPAHLPRVLGEEGKGGRGAASTVIN